MAGNISTLALGGGIKSTQRGTVTIADTASTGTATITAVDMTKAQLRNLGSYPGSSTLAALGYIVLTNSTTITATRGTTTGATVISWELTEYY